MELLNNADAIIELIQKYVAETQDKPFLEIELVIKNIESGALQKLVEHYEPQFPVNETLMEPTVSGPHFWFFHKINNSISIEFRGPDLQTTVTFK